MFMRSDVRDTSTINGTTGRRHSLVLLPGLLCLVLKLERAEQTNMDMVIRCISWIHLKVSRARNDINAHSRTRTLLAPWPQALSAKQGVSRDQPAKCSERGTCECMKAYKSTFSHGLPQNCL